MDKLSLPKQFILKPPSVEKHSMVHSSCYRLSMSILHRAEQEPVAIPIEKLGMYAVISENKIMFAKPETDEPGILISWEFFVAEDRDSKNQHLPMNISYFDEQLEELQQSLTGEFYKALMLADEKYKEKNIPAQNIEIVSRQ